MSETIQRYPLQWPAGWHRTKYRERARFSRHGEKLSIYEGIQRVRSELQKLDISDEHIVVSTNMKVRLDGFPLSNQAEPQDPGVCVYWRRGSGAEQRCIAVDRYDRAADNLGAVAATLEAMRAIERHGGAAILDRAFIGFKALPAPEQWWQVLGLSGDIVTKEDILQAHRRLAKIHHPDNGGEDWQMARINAARDRGLEYIGAK